jgi:gliding motility-associated-like protein
MADARHLLIDMNRFWIVLLALVLAVPAQAQCLLTWDTTSTPGYGGTGTTYEANETVQICLSVNTWNSSSANWFHGFEIILGPGWDATSVVGTSLPASCDGNGNWALYPSITSSATGASYGQGFYYDSGSGGPLDGIPGNNYGDNSACPAPHWVQFCFDVTTLPPGLCVEGADLSITLNTLGDGEAGSWSSFDCNGDPNIVFSGPTLSCCDPPIDTFFSPTCPGGSDGSIIAVGNSTGPYTFDWSTGLFETTPDSSSITGLGAGTYTLAITDAGGCTSNQTYVLTDPPAIAMSLDSIEPVTCPGGSNGAVLWTASGGTAPIGGFTYSLDGGPTQVFGLFENLSAGTYTVTAFDANGCSKDTTFSIIEDNLLELALLDVQDVDCFGDTTGSVDLGASGGIPPYTYSSNGVDYSASPIFANLAGGDYTFSVQDATGCVVTVDATIDEPVAPVLDAGEYLPIPNGREVTLEPSTNVDPVASWMWSPADGLSCVDCPNPVASPEQTTWYTVTVTDANGCSVSDSTELVVIRTLAIPNAFSPNGDGLNDIFIVRTPYVEDFVMRIFNRWGEQVFATNDINIGWDGTHKGKPAEMGTFLYTLQMTTDAGEAIQKQGTITLIR